MTLVMSRRSEEEGEKLIVECVCGVGGVGVNGAAVEK
jgi:hypothetical protein